MSTAKKVRLGKTEAIGKIASFSVIFGPILMRFFLQNVQGKQVQLLNALKTLGTHV
jgi:hypothetical protein